MHSTTHGVTPQRYTLVKPAQGLTPRRVQRVNELCITGPGHLDLETTGLDPLTGEVVGVGWADGAGVQYVDVRTWHPFQWGTLLTSLRVFGMYAFNAVFDWAWLLHKAQQLRMHPPRLLGCSLTLFRLLATEGHPGQRWNLDTAVREVLQWPVSQKTTLAELMIKHGIVKSGGTPDKGRLHQLQWHEPEAFAEYCGNDADASYQLWDLLWRTAEAWPAVRQFATEEWVVMIQLLAEQQLRGLVADRPKLAAYLAQLESDTAATQAALRGHPRVAPHVEAWETAAAAEFYASRYTERRVRAKLRDQPWEHPERWTFFPSAAKSLASWERDRGGYYYYPERTEVARNVGRAAPQFNFESDPHLRWLLYEQLYTHKLDTSHHTVAVTVESGDTVTLPLTAGGKPPVGKDILPALGEIGALLTKFNRLTKEAGYVRAYLEASARDGLIHPQFRTHGALTGRLSSGGSG